MAVTKSKKTASKAAAKAGKPAAAAGAKSYGKKSRKVLVIAILVVIVLAIPLVYGGVKLINKSRDNVLKRDGIAAAHAGDHDRAAELLGRFVKRHPTEVEALRAYIVSREQAEMPNGQHLVETGPKGIAG